MTQQISLGQSGRADEAVLEDGIREIAPDLAYRRLVMVNVVFYGSPDAGDRGWVLVDTGVVGPKSFIVSAAAARFGKGAAPSKTSPPNGTSPFTHTRSSNPTSMAAPLTRPAIPRSGAA